MNPDDEDQEQLDAWQAYKVKKDKKELEALKLTDEAMEMLDSLESIEKSIMEQMWESVEHWLLKNKPQEWHNPTDPVDPNKIADVCYTVTLKKTCSCAPIDSVITQFKVFSAKPNNDTVLECASCCETLLIDELTIVNIDVKVAPPCIGCGKALYEAQEGALRVCDKCDTIYTNIHQTFNSYNHLEGLPLPLEGQILRRVNVLNNDDYSGKVVNREIVAEVKNANIITSEIAGTYDHKPVLDIDLNCKLIPSTHAGHYHLYIDKAMSWEKYRELLKALKEAGVIEPGYYNAALARKFTGVRLPWIKKESKKD
jgi:hypothetical protein